MQKEDKTGVIVLGGHVQALGIVRAFGRKQILSIIIDSTLKNITRHSKYCKQCYIIKEEFILDFLLNPETSTKYSGWIVFPTNDFHVKLLSIHKNELEKTYRISTDYWDKIKIFYNKVETYKLAQQLNIPIAETFFPTSENDLRNIDPTYPCIIKPAVMFDFFKQVKKKVFVCNSYEELIDNYRIALTFIPPEEIIVQNIIQGPSKNQYSACFLFINGKPIVSLTACRMRQHPIDFGNATTYAETVDIPLLKEYAVKILSKANYNGLCEVEFKKDSIDGEYKFLEVNTRTWKWHAIAQKAEAPFLYYYYKILLNKEVIPVNSYKFATFRHGLTDFPIQLKLFLKGFNYAFKCKKPQVKAVWDINDIAPWIYEKLYLIYLIKTR